MEVLRDQVNTGAIPDLNCNAPQKRSKLKCLARCNSVLKGRKESVEEERWKFALLPLHIHRHVASFLEVYQVCTAEVLSLCLALPQEYLRVRLKPDAGEENGLVSVLLTQPPNLREVTMFLMDCYVGNPLVKALFTLDALEHLNLKLKLSYVDADTFVRQCCKSRHTRHLLELDFSEISESPEDAIDIIETLIRDDRSLVKLSIVGFPDRRAVRDSYLKLEKSHPLNLCRLSFMEESKNAHDVKLLVDSLKGNCSMRYALVADALWPGSSFVFLGAAVSPCLNRKSLPGYDEIVHGFPAQLAVILLSTLDEEEVAFLRLRDEDGNIEGANAFARLIELTEDVRTPLLNYCTLGQRCCHAVADKEEVSTSLDNIEFSFDSMDLEHAEHLLDSPQIDWSVSVVRDERFGAKVANSTSSTKDKI